MRRRFQTGPFHFVPKEQPNTKRSFSADDSVTSARKDVLYISAVGRYAFAHLFYNSKKAISLQKCPVFKA